MADGLERTTQSVLVGNIGRSENGARAGRTPVLDVRVQPGGQNAPEFSDLQRFADTQGVTLRIAEFPKP